MNDRDDQTGQEPQCDIRPTRAELRPYQTPTLAIVGEMKALTASGSIYNPEESFNNTESPRP